MNGGSSGGQRMQPSPPDASAREIGVLEVRGVTVRFGGITALDDVSLTAPPRQVTGIIGPNGAGKTTLLNVLCGLVRPQAGQIRFDGRELTRLRPHRLTGLGIARTLQGVGLFDGLSAVENVMVGATCHARAGFWSGMFGLPWSDRDERALRQRALDALDLVDAADLADSMPGTLAYGLRKRVALARALVARPRLLLLDEPASGLSESELPEIGDLIEKLAADASVVVIEHRMDLMMSVCDTITVLDFGKVIAGGTPDQVQADPAVTAAYLGVEAGRPDKDGSPASADRSGSHASPDDGGGLAAAYDGGGQAAAADRGGPAAADDAGERAPADDDSGPAAADVGGERAAADEGGGRGAADTDSGPAAAGGIRDRAAGDE
jgi:branched-chain amino acid transport system ATP-binding protein